MMSVATKNVYFVILNKRYSTSLSIHGYFMKVTRKIKGCFEIVLRLFQGCFKGVS